MRYEKGRVSYVYLLHPVALKIITSYINYHESNCTSLPYWRVKGVLQIYFLPFLVTICPASQSACLQLSSPNKSDKFQVKHDVVKCQENCQKIIIDIQTQLVGTGGESEASPAFFPIHVMWIFPNSSKKGLSVEH